MANEFRVKNGIISSSIGTESGDFTIDSAGDIILDCDDTDIILKDGGTSFGSFKRASSDFIIKSETADKDIIFKGNDSDGGGVITALTLDMSEAGAATFGGGIADSGTISAGTWSASTIAVNKGGTGQTSYTNGQLLIGNTTGNTLAKATLTAGDGIDITNGAGSITIAAETASATNPGVVELATTAETTTGTDTTRAVTPDGLKDGYQGSSNVTTLGTISTGTWSGTTIAVNKGGTGQTSYTNGQLLIGNTTGNTLAKATLTAGSGISITNGAGSITIAASGGGGGISDLVDDTSPQLGGDLDTNGHDIIIDDGKGIYADAISNGRELMLFGHTSSANSYIKIWNGISDTTAGTLFGTDVVSSSGNTVAAGRMTGPGFEATGDETDVGMSFKTKGLGMFVFTNDDATNAASPSILLLRNNLEGEVADDDDIGIIKFMGADSAMIEEGSVQAIHDYRDYARIGVEVPDQTSGNADGELYFSILVKDSQRRLLAVGSNNLAHGDTPAAGVAAKAGQVRTFSSGQALDYDDYAGLYLVATSALTFTLPANPNRGEQYVIISDTTGTVTIDRNGNTINGASSNATITTRYEAKTFIAMDSGAYIMLG